MMTTSAVWRRIRAEGFGTLAVMGMTKNTGKTVALNHILACAAAESMALGVTSIGRDGEERDQVFSFPKPPVMVWPGTLVATARDTLLRSKVRFKTVCSTGLDSPMGEIMLVKVLEHGEMEIAGASRSTELLKIIAQLKQCGSDLVVLDGALGRSHHASPAIADGVVLATGAAIGGGVQDVVRKTRDRLAILGVPQATPELVQRCLQVFAHGGVGIWAEDGTELFLQAIPTLNAANTLLQYADQRVATVAVSGAVGRSLWRALQALLAQHAGLTLVVADGTRLFVEQTDLAVFAKQGGRVVANRGIHIAGLTVNPFSPMGGDFDAQELLDTARAAFPHYDVMDVVLEEKSVETLGVSA